jgi:hypothetical protein
VEESGNGSGGQVKVQYLNGGKEWKLILMAGKNRSLRLSEPLDMNNANIERLP